MALQIIFDRFFDAYDKSLKASEEYIHNDMFKRMEGQCTQRPLDVSSSAQTAKSSTNKFTSLKKNLIIFGPWCTLIVVMTVVMASYENWSVLTSIYFAIVTATSGKDFFILTIPPQLLLLVSDAHHLPPFRIFQLDTVMLLLKRQK